MSRLTLVSGVPVSEADATGTTIYFGSLALPLDDDPLHSGFHQSGKNFDLFLIDDGGTDRLASGPAWVSDTDRGTGAGTTELEAVSGDLVNKVDIDARFGTDSVDVLTVPAGEAIYLGSFRATGDGQTTDTRRQRLLFNADNQVERPLFVYDGTSSWQYTTFAYRIARGNSLNCVETLIGLSGSTVHLTANGVCSNSTSSPRAFQVGIGLDSTTVPAADSLTGYGSASNIAMGAQARYDACPGLGFHKFNWLEFGSGPDTQTWYGTTAISARTGMAGYLLA